jgi:hypothetical protein
MNGNPWKCATLVLSAALAVIAAFPPGAASAATPTNLEAALEKLEGALSLLQKSTQDQGGHRMKSIAHTRQAIEEVKLGIAAAKKDRTPPAPTAPAPLEPHP